MSTLKSRFTGVAGALILSLGIAPLADAQQSGAGSQANWNGWARCEISVSGQGYSDQQTQTWTLTGGAPTMEGAFRVYPATWSVVGGGSVQRSQGTQTLTAQWARTAQGLSAPLAVFVRASDKRMFIQARHAQLRAAGAVSGYQQLTIDGKPQLPGKVGAEAFEWSFPVVEVPRPQPDANLTANGSSTPAITGSVGFMQPADTQARASCTWHFNQGDSAPAPPPAVAAQPVPTPAGTSTSTSPPAGQTSSGGNQTSSGAANCVSAPQNLNATANNAGLVGMTWLAPASGAATSYVIQASATPGGPANLANFNTGNANVSLNVPNVPAGTYYLRVEAVAACGTGPPSNEVQLIVGTTQNAVCPSAPQDLTSSVAAHSATLNWAAPASGTPTSYVVQAGSAPGGANLANFDTGSTALTLVSPGVGSGSYYVRVYAKAAACPAPIFVGPASNEVLLVVQ